MAHKSGAFHLDSPDEKLEVSVSESDTDFTVEIVATLNGRMSDLTFIYCRTAEQVRALVPGFRSKAEQAADEAADAPLVAEASAVARPFQVGDKVRVLRVPGVCDSSVGVPYESVVVKSWLDGLVVGHYDNDGEGTWHVDPADVELIAPAEEPAQVTA